MRIAVSTEVKDLIPDADDLDITWFSTQEGPPTGDFKGMVCALTVRVDQQVLEAMPDLEIVANVAVGYDNIDVKAARSRGIEVTNTPDVLTAATADLTMGLVIAASRRFAEGRDLLTEGRWEGWQPTQLLGLELHEATIGIVGAGKIGRAVAERARSFGMRIVYTSRSEKTGFQAEKVDLTELLQRSDVVSLHIPLNDETRGLIGRDQLMLMKQNAVLVNTARGGVIDEKALLDVLMAGHLAGVGLDVFDGEPDVDLELVRHPKVFALPHLGSATRATRRRMVQVAVENVRAVLSGKSALNPVPR